MPLEICVDNENIELMKGFVFDEEQEFCINLISSKRDGKTVYSFNIDTISQGIHETLDDGRQRAACKYKQYSTVIFHSHPKLSRSYPSYEDIIKLRHEEIEISIIATRWGIYTIKKSSKSKDVNLLTETIKSKIYGYLYRIQTLEDSTGYSRQNSLSGNLTLNQSQINELVFYLGKIGEHTKLYFKFYPWSHFNL